MCMRAACVLSRISCVWLCATLWTVACQAPLSMGFSRQEYCTGLPCPPPGNLPNPALLQCRWTFYHLSGQGSPKTPDWVAYPFSRGTSRPRNQTSVSCTAGSWATREALRSHWEYSLPLLRYYCLHTNLTLSKTFFISMNRKKRNEGGEEGRNDIKNSAEGIFWLFSVVFITLC